jgi:membrane-bound metal-dependent hydrolase YbcI (DUF457 family)
MNGRSHHLLGLAVAVAVAPRVAPDVPAALTLTMATYVTAGGALSPDMDQSAWWRMFDHILPDEILGHGGPARHRGLTHWWGLPALALCALLASADRSLTWWACAGVTLGWAAHLLGDLIVGAGSRHRGPGIPLWPWWGHVGCGFRCGGAVETVISTVSVPVAIVWECAVLAGVVP